MSGDERRTEVRSYRAVFDLERRLYRIDRLRLNPSGVPVRGILYALALIALVLVAGRLPLTGMLLGLLPWPLRYVGLPVGLGALATVARLDGRPAHTALRSVVRHVLAPRYRCGLGGAARPGSRWTPGALVLIPDGSDTHMRRLRFSGPGAVLVRRPHRRAVWASRRGSVIALDERAGPALEHATVVRLRAGARLECESARREAR